MKSHHDTPEFRSWFDQSKVVDRDGIPLTVYHGTIAPDFDAFRKTSELGFHFGSQKSANRRLQTFDYPAAKTPKSAPRIIPAYLSIKNPLRLPDLNTWEPQEVLWHLSGDPGILTEDQAYALEDRATHGMIRKLITKAGYDGIVYWNKLEGGGDSYIAFHPNQIKSAIGNSGDYSKEDERFAYTQSGYASYCSLMEQAGLSPKTEPEWREAVRERYAARAECYKASDASDWAEWSRDTKAAGGNGQPLTLYHGTDQNIEDFDPLGGSDFGTHLGTAEQANEFIRREGGRIYPVHIQARNPLRLPDMERWSYDTLAPALNKLGIHVPKVEHRPETADMYENMRRTQRRQHEAIASALEQAGHDSIVYRNQFEGYGSEHRDGADSWIVFRPHQIRSATVAKPSRYTMTAQEIDDAVAGWKEPSKAQIEAENYRKPRIRIHGLEIAIENPKGTRRKPEWPELSAHYGYVSRVAGQSAPEARDEDKVDVFVGPTPRSEIVFVIDQEHPSGRYDEPKAMLAFTNEADAKRAYLASYSPGHHCGTITAMTVPQFKSWLEHGDTKRRVAEQVSRYTAESSWDITPDHNPRRDIEQATSRARADCGTPPARYAESMSEQPNDLEHALQTVAARYNLSAADKRELLDRYCQEIAGPRPRNLEDDLEQVARELDLSPSEAAAVKRQYEARFAGDVERYAAQYDTIDDVIAGLNSDAINPARATQLARSLGHGKELRHNQQHPFHEAVRGYRKRNPGPPLTDEQRASIEESRRKAAKEDARDEMIGKQLAAAESELERRGAKLYYRSESGSGYWDLPDGRKLRLSDHSLPSTDSRDARFLNQDLSPWDEELVFAKGRGTEQHGIDRVAELFDQQPEAPNGPQDPGDQAGQ